MRPLLLARFISLTGTNMTTVALPWFVLAATGSVEKMGIVLACQTLPAFVLGIPGGAVVAALGARRAMILGDALRAPMLAAVPALHAAGRLSFPMLLVLVTAIGVFSVPYSAAASSILPEVVGEDEKEVTRAQSALQVTIQVTGIVGPVAAGALIPLIGAPRLLYLDAASYALSAFVVLAFVSAGRATAKGALRRNVLVGVKRVFSDSLLVSIVGVALVAHVALAALFASLPALAYREFHDARTAGVLFTADAVGSVLGGLLAVRLARRVDAMKLGIAGFAAMSAPVWLLTLGTPRLLAIGVMFLFGIGGPLGIAPISAVLTTRASGEIRPQVVSAFLSITSAGTPIGAALTGVAIAHVGFGPTYGAVAAGMTVATLLLVWCVRRVSAVAPDAVPATTS